MGWDSVAGLWIGIMVQVVRSGHWGRDGRGRTAAGLGHWGRDGGGRTAGRDDGVGLRVRKVGPGRLARLRGRDSGAWLPGRSVGRDNGVWAAGPGRWASEA